MKDGCSAGFFGCFGCGAALLLVVLGLVVWAMHTCEASIKAANM